MGSGKLWDDLGSTTFVTAKNDAEETRPSARNAKRREISRNTVGSSDDELDFLSSSSRSEDVEELVPTKNKPRTKKKQPGTIIQGQDMDYHPDYLPKKKLPDFKKVTNAVPEERSLSACRSKTSGTTKKAPKQARSYGMLAALHDNENGRLSSLSGGPTSDEESFVDDIHLSTQVSSQPEVRKFPGLALSPLRAGNQDPTHTDTPRDRTKGSTSYKQSKPSRSKTASHSSGTKSRSTTTSHRASRIQSSDSSDSSEATPLAKHPGNRVRKFPTLDPLSISDQMDSGLDGRGGEAPFNDATSSIPSRSALPDTTTPKKSKSRYPFPSPLSSPPHQPSQGSSSATAFRGTHLPDTLDVMEVDYEHQKRGLQPRPFPMAVSQTKEAHRTPRRTIAYTGQTYPDNGRNNAFFNDLDAFADDSLFMEESTDPSSLCPFCDEKLPPNLSPLYRSLLEAARRKAYSDPRPTNLQGLKAQMGVYIASCKRHRFEAHQIPEAIAKGWPTDIDFGKLRERVERLAGRLTKLVLDEGNAREESIFWTIVMTEVRKLGSRAASGVKGQFESFEKTQPGYYGELGSMILHQTLYNMFPPSSIDPQSITPLAPQEFIQRILVPEAALTLIMEDTGQDQVKAVQTMRESAGYGMAMFPDTSEGPGVGAGEDIVLERARARRRELEDEERIEASLSLMDSEEEHAIQTKGTKRPKKLSGATTTDVEEVHTARHKMKRTKAGSRTDAESGPDPDGREPRTMSARKNNTVIHSNVAADPSRTEPSPLPLSIPRARSKLQSLRNSSPKQTLARTSRPEQQEFAPKPTTLRNPQRRQEGLSINVPIDVDGPQAIAGAEEPSASEQQPSISDSSDAQELGVHSNIPNPRLRPRRRIIEHNSSTDPPPPRNDPVSQPTGQGQWRDSSVEVIEPPQSGDQSARRKIPDSVKTLLNEYTSRASRRARRSPTAAGTSNLGHDRHDWLMNDSSD